MTLQMDTATMGKFNNKLFGVMCLYLMPSIAVSQGFQVNFQGQKQQGMGLAGTALYQDASTLFYNPGAAAFAQKNSINIGATPIIGNVLYVDSLTNEGYRTNNPIGKPFFAYGLFHWKDSSSLKLGLAVYTPFGSTVQWEDNWAGRFALTRLSLSAIFIQPTFSYKVSEKIGVGGGFVASVGSFNLQRDLPIQFTDGTYARASLTGQAFGLGYNIGIHYQASKQFGIGLTYRSSVNKKVNSGQAEFTVPAGVSQNFPSGTFSSSLPLPAVASVGFAYKFNEKLTLVADVNFVGWQAYDTLAFDYVQNTASLQDTKSARNYKNIFAFRGGASYALNDRFVCRIGGGFGFTPVPNGYSTPETPDANRTYGTLGLSYNLGAKFTIDASILYTQMQRPDTNLETLLSGTYFTKAVAPGFSLVYKW